MAMASYSVLPVLAATTPLPSSLANGLAYINFQNNAYPWGNLIGPYPAGYGGAFTPLISTVSAGGAPTGTPALATVWCVDYQLNVTTDAAYVTEVTSLNNIQSGASGYGSTDSNVRYGNTDSTGAAGWVNAVADPEGLNGGDPNSAAYRYTLAAALISAYEDSNGVVDPQSPDGNSTGGADAYTPVNQAIQEAVWYITANNEYPTQTDPPFSMSSPACPAGGSSANYLCWVAYAETNASSVRTAEWGVVSGPADPATGYLLDPTNSCATCLGYNSFQTDLVQLAGAPGTQVNQATPEPGFYAALGLGLSGMWFLIRRRKTA